MTNRGPFKAVYMATRPIGVFRRDAFEVRVEDDGELEFEESGVVRMDGYGIDRYEW
jgi:hypothetical protein